MKEQPNDLWRGGPWEQPSPSFPTPPPVVVPARRPPVLRVRRRRRTLLPFLALFLLVVGLSLGTVAVRWLLPWDDEPLTPHLSEQEERDPFAALERAETGTGVQVQISQREGEVMDAVEIYEKGVPSVVSIQADGEGEYSTGTGVVMSADGYILTNAHVVADSLRMSVLLSDGRVMEARLVGADAGEDLAVLKVEASGLTPAEFGDSDRLRWWWPSGILWATAPLSLRGSSPPSTAQCRWTVWNFRLSRPARPSTLETPAGPSSTTGDRWWALPR